MTKPQIILASASIGRKDLLKKLRIPFKVIASTIDEDKITHLDPFKMLQLRARAKAKDVVKKLTANCSLPTANYLIIAADSMAILDSQTYGKARDKSHARQILQALMGKTHIFATASCIIYLSFLKTPKYPKLPSFPKILHSWHHLTKTKVTLRTLSSNSLTNYLTLYDFTRFAAGYALNETPWDLVTKIEGSYTNVIGLPFEILLPILNKLKII